jgi:hypothetical protein
MAKHIDKVLDGSKDLTTRLATDFRKKMKWDDIAYIYTGIRTKKAQKHAEAKIINLWLWYQTKLSKDFITTMFGDWEEFYKREGFTSWEKLEEYFSQPRYKDKLLVTYQFEIITDKEKWVIKK